MRLRVLEIVGASVRFSQSKSNWENDALLRRVLFLLQLFAVGAPMLALSWSLQLLHWRATQLLGHAPQFPFDQASAIGANDAFYQSLLNATDFLIALNFVCGAPCFVLAGFLCWRYGKSAARASWAFPFVYVVLWLWLVFGDSHLRWFMD